MNEYIIKVTDDTKEYVGTFKQPDLDIYKEFFNLILKDRMDADAFLAKNCFLSGDAELIDFDNHIDLFLSYRYQLLDILNINRTEKIKDNLPEGAVIGVKVFAKDEQVLTGYFGKPNFMTMKKVMNLYENGLTFEGNMEFARNCFLSGDQELIQYLKYPEYLVSYKYILDDLLSLKLVEIKKK